MTTPSNPTASSPSASKPRAYQKILVPLDGSEFAATALPHAQLIAKQFGAELYLFHAIYEPVGYIPAREGPAMTTIAVGPGDEEFARRLESTKRALELTAAEPRRDEIRVHTATRIGPPAETIVDFAVEEKIDLIVMSTHGRSGLARWAFGSVANKVIQGAGCPVLTIRPVEA